MPRMRLAWASRSLICGSDRNGRAKVKVSALTTKAATISDTPSRPAASRTRIESGGRTDKGQVVRSADCGERHAAAIYGDKSWSNGQRGRNDDPEAKSLEDTGGHELEA